MVPNRLKKAIPIVVYALLAIAIMGPLLKPGYIFLLDYVSGPQVYLAIKTAYINSLPFEVLSTAFSYLLTPMVAQKLIIFLVLFIAGVAMYYSAPVKKTWARYFAGFLYVVNPFVFARLQAGHIGLLFVYALTPWVIQSLFRFLKKPDKRSAAIAGAWLAAAAMMALHGLYLLLVLGIGLVVYLWLNRSDRKYLASLFKYLAVLLLVFAILSAFWLVPAMLLKSPVAGIDSRQIEIFATHSDQQSGVYLNVAAMNGFWQTEIFESKNLVPGWPYLFMILFALAVWGLAAGIRDEDKRPAALIVGLTMVIAFVLALGTASPATAWLYRLLFENISPFRGFREPQKFVGLLAFGYAYLGALGLEDLMKRLGASRPPHLNPLPAGERKQINGLDKPAGERKQINGLDKPAGERKQINGLDRPAGERKQINGLDKPARSPALEGRGLGGAWLPSRVSGTPTFNSSPLQRGKELLSAGGRVEGFLLAAFFIVVVFFYTWPTFWGLGGHAKSVDYPRSWYRAEAIMSEDPAAGAVLFLPWHLYMPMSFNDAGKVVANPAPHFFKRDVVFGKNAELTGAGSTNTDKQQKTFEDILASGKRSEAIAGEFRTEGVRYVVLVKDADWTAYGWLYSQRDVKKIYGAREIIVFRVD